MKSAALDRREFFRQGGALVVGFTLASAGLAQQLAPRPQLPGSLNNNRMLDGWLRINADGTVTVFTGKVELGQGILTALAQIAAEELDIAYERVEMISADTSRSPDEGMTAGSLSVENSGTALRFAAAEAHEMLLQLAAARLGVPAGKLAVSDGTVSAGAMQATYWELVKSVDLKREATARARPKSPASHRIVGKSIKRRDIPNKVSGAAAYVQDIRLPGMLFGRVVRPSAPGSRLENCDEAAVRAMPGVVAVVRDGSFLAVAAEREEQAIKAANALRTSAKWTAGTALPPQGSALFEHLQKLPARDSVVNSKVGAPSAGGPVTTIEAKYTRPYQCHASIGPSCAVAQVKDGKLTVWTHSQGVYPLRQHLARVMRMSEASIIAVHVEGSGCYGHNGADDVACDASLVERHRRPPGQAAMDARRRVRVGTIRLRDGDEIAGARRCERAGRRLAARDVEPSAQHAAGWCGQQSARWLGYCQPRADGCTNQRRAARGRGRPQCRAALCISEPAHHPALSARDAATHLRVAHAGRLRKCLRARVVHRRTRGCSERGSG